MAALSDYITVEDVTTFKAVDGTAAQARVQEALITACDLFEHEVGRPMIQADYSELLSGDGSDILMTTNWPLVSVSYVQVVDTEWRVVDAATGTMEDLNTYQVFIPMHRLWLKARGGSYTSFTQGFGLNPSVLGASFPEGVGNILVTYAAGYLGATPLSTPIGWYKVLPARHKTAICAMAHLILNEKSWIGLGSKTVGGGFESIQQVMRKYDEYPIIGDVIDCERRRGT